MFKMIYDESKLGLIKTVRNFHIINDVANQWFCHIKAA